MTPLEYALETVAADLDAVGAAWAVVGGLAVSARAEPRLTRDVDIAVAVASDAAAEALVRLLTQRGYQICTRGFARGRDLQALFGALGADGW